MSSFSIDKFGDNLPVTGVMAFSQAVLGFGVGLLLADKLGRSARQRTAIALIGAGAATIVPLIAGIVSSVSNRPTSSRRLRRQLESIRDDTGFSNGTEIF